MTMPYLADTRSLRDADQLIADFGSEATTEAAARASRSRDLGNASRFCHWRQVERLVELLADERPIGTVH